MEQGGEERSPIDAKSSGGKRRKPLLQMHLHQFKKNSSSMLDVADKRCIIGSMSQKEIIHELRTILITFLGFAAFGWAWLYVMGAAALFLVIMASKKKLRSA